MGFNYLCFSAYDSDGKVVDGSIPYVTSSGALGGMVLGGVYPYPQYWMIPVSWNGTKCNLIDMSQLSSTDRYVNCNNIAEITRSAPYTGFFAISAPDSSTYSHTCACLYTYIGSVCTLYSWTVPSFGLLRVNHCSGTEQTCLKWYTSSGSFETNIRMSATPTSSIINVCIGICGHGNSESGYAVKIPLSAFIIRAFDD